MRKKGKPGRKPIGDRVCFACPDELFNYVEFYGKDNGLVEWSEAIRHMISDHRKKNVCGKAPLIESSKRVQ